MEWGEWQELPQFGSISPKVLSELLDGGQSFRWEPAVTDQRIWQGVFQDIVLQVRHQPDFQLNYRLLAGGAEHEAVRTYFGCERNWDLLSDNLPWRSDHELKASMDTFPKLRILKQPLGETLFSFICSTAKQIPQIKQCCLNVSKRFGKELISGVYSWPGWETLASVTEMELRDCKLGYRAKYISAIAQTLAREQDFETKIQNKGFDEAKSMLMELPGVGEKVADCVLLFAAGKLEAFPVDTWILKAMKRIYNLENWDSGKVAHFGRVHFGKYAGLAQQFLFARERMLSI